jgi:hypothetical protein
MGPASTAMSLGATGLSVAGTLFSSSTRATNALSQGNATGERDEFQSAELARRATYGEIKANQVDAFMRDSLASSLANITAIRASAGMSDSPTEDAIKARAGALGDAARFQKVSNINEQTQEDRDASAFYQRAGLNAIQAGRDNARAIETSGYLTAGGQLLSGLAGATSPGGSMSSIMSSIGAMFA